VTISLKVTQEIWPIKGQFTISRGSKTHIEVIVATLSSSAHQGWAESVPYARYGETCAQVIEQIQSLAQDLKNDITRQDLQHKLKAGSARNALDCALWDLEAKRTKISCFKSTGMAKMQPKTTAFTLSLDTPEAMAHHAKAQSHRPLLKIKLGGAQDEACLNAVRHAAPQAQLIIDANEGWTPQNLHQNIKACEQANVLLIEQPLPANQDEALKGLDTIILICADESFHDETSFATLKGKYHAINIKLDKTGGLTQALTCVKLAKHQNYAIMAGCMVATSLAMAPAMIIAQHAQFIDLDGPLLLAKDRAHGLTYDNSLVHPPLQTLWG
jgi:L-Ala-D/L-Glu epimerase